MKRIIIVLLVPLFFASCQKIDEDYLHIKYYGSANENAGYSIAVANDGYYLCGQTTMISTASGSTEFEKRMIVIKTDFSGKTVWELTLGDTLTTFGSKVIIIEDGSLVCAGYAMNTKTENKDIYIARITSEKTVITDKVFSSAGNQTCTDIIRTEEGFMVLGTTDEKNLQSEGTGNAEGKTDILLMRLDINLNPVAMPIPLGFPGNDVGASIKNDLNGGYIIAGTTDKSEINQGGNNILLVQVNKTCSTKRYVILGSTDDESAADMEVVDDGYLIAGTIGKESENLSPYLIKIPGDDIHKTAVFSRTFTGTASRSLAAINRYKKNYFVLTGQEGAETSADMFFFTVDYEGNTVEGQEKLITGTGIQAAYDVATDAQDNILGVGKNSYESNSMITLVKFRF